MGAGRQKAGVAEKDGDAEAPAWIVEPPPPISPVAGDVEPMA